MQSLKALVFIQRQLALTSFLVSMAQWPHFDSIPNSIVKHCSGEDSEDASPCQNSSMPGSITKKTKKGSSHYRAALLFGYISIRLFLPYL